MNEEQYIERCRLYVDRGRITGVEYRRGAIVSGWPERHEIKGDATKRRKRGKIGSQSARSLIRASFAVSNAETDWVAMVTLTFRERHDHPKECLREWMRRMWDGGPSRYGVMWWQEYQRRGIVHYHLLMDADALTRLCLGDAPEWVDVGRGKQRRTVLGGTMGRRAATMWLEETGDLSYEAYAFNLGGIVEKLADHEQAARYVASYIKKLAQKTLPDGECPSGRWWWMSEAVAPQPRSWGVLESYPLKRPHHLVFDKSELQVQAGGDENNRIGLVARPRASGSDSGQSSTGGTPDGVAGSYGVGGRSYRLKLNQPGHGQVGIVPRGTINEEEVK